MKIINVCIAMGVCLGLAGCDNAADPDTGSTPPTPVSGLAVDGYLAGATVYADLNDNNRRDSFEPRALTDAFGFFSSRPAFTLGAVNVPARNYCVAGPERHCLRLPANISQARVRVQGGFDLLTGESFSGELSRFLNVADGNTVFAITPLTSLDSGITSGQRDHIGDYPGGAFNAGDMRLAVEIQAVVTRLADGLLAALTFTDANRPTLAILQGRIYRELQSRGINTASEWNALDQTAFEAIVAAVVATLQPSSTPAATLATERAQDALAFRGVVTQSDPAADPPITRAQAESYVFAILTYAQARRDLAVVSGDAPRYLTLLNRILALLPGDRRNLDRRQLAERFRDTGDTLADLSSSVVVEAFPALADKKLEVENDDDPSDTVPPKRIALYFQADASSTSEGPLILCISGFRDADVSDFGDGNTLRLTGRWAQPTDKSLALTLSAFGGTFEASAALRVRAGDSSGPIPLAFEYEGEDEPFDIERTPGQTLDDFFLPIGTVPAECAAP